MYSYFKKIYSCISKRDKKYIVPIIILILLNTLIELVGIGVFIPLINIILSPESYDTNKFLIFLSNSNILSNFDISSILILLIIIFFLFRFFFQSFYFLIIQKFLHKVSLNLSSNLINIYMKQPIQISLKSKPSTMFKNLYTEVNTLKAQTLIMIKFVSDLILSLAIFSILIFFNPVITIVAILFLFSFFLLYLFFSKNYTLLLGSKRFYHNEYLSNILTECFNSLREIKLFNMYKYFNKNFLFHKDVEGWSKIKNLFLRQLPIFFIELLVVIVFSIIIIYSLKINYDTDQLIITLGFYAICFIRLLPVVNKISETYQSYKFSKVAIEKIYDDYQKRISVKLDDDLNLNQTEIPFNKNIKIKNLKFNYNEKSEFNIDVKEFIINKNEYIGIYGNSGSGKSTFVDLISGLTKPHSGNIYSDELDIYENLSLWRKKIGYVPQNIYLLDDTIENNICIIDKIDTSFKDKNYFEEILKMCDLIELHQDYKENSIGEGGSRISGGQKQRIGIARALYKKPEILILDEPTSSLDFDTEKKFLSSLKKLKNKITIIYISHKLETFKDSDRVIKIVNGKIYEN